MYLRPPRNVLLGARAVQRRNSRGPKVSVLNEMPAPHDVFTLRSFLGSVQFHAKFLPPTFASVAEPLYRLTRKGHRWTWGSEKEAAFRQLKELLSTADVLAHFDPSLPLGVICDASAVGIGATLFHRYSDGSERPIANISKTLTASQPNYSQIQKEALAIIYALKKFFQYLYGRKFLLVTDHQPLVAMFGPNKPTPALAANRSWALFLRQFNYTIEYRKTSEHSNADVLSRLPVDEDRVFDRDESTDDVDTVCTIETLSLQVEPTDSGTLRKESSRDPTLTKVLQFTREGCPEKKDGDDPAEKFRKIADSLSVCHGCLLYGARVVIPTKLRRQVLDLLHECHFGIQRMKQLARTALYCRTSIPTFSIYAGNVRLAPGISPNRRKLPSTRGCYLRSCGAAYILITPSTFWVSTGLWLLTPVLSIPASMQRSQYQRSQRSNSCKK